MSEIPEEDEEEYQEVEGSRPIGFRFVSTENRLVFEKIYYSSKIYQDARGRIRKDYSAALIQVQRNIQNASEESSIARNPVPAPPAPPTTGQYLLSLVAPLSRQDEVLGDLSERFTIQTGRFGLRRAKFWYWWCVARLVTTYTCRGAVGLLGLAELVDKFRSR